jgi:hypothetical protein
MKLDRPIHEDSNDAIKDLEIRSTLMWFWARGMRALKSVEQAQRFLDVHAAVYNLFNLGRHLICAEYYRSIRMSAFASGKAAAA